MASVSLPVQWTQEHPHKGSAVSAPRNLGAWWLLELWELGVRMRGTLLLPGEGASFPPSGEWGQEHSFRDVTWSPCPVSRSADRTAGRYFLPPPSSLVPSCFVSAPPLSLSVSFLCLPYPGGLLALNSAPAPRATLLLPGAGWLC